MAVILSQGVISESSHRASHCSSNKRKPVRVIPTCLVGNIVPQLLCLKIDVAEVSRSEKSLGPLNTGEEETLITSVTQKGT